MAGDLTLALRSAQSGLATNQQALNTVANNVANANTDGYSRKVVNVEQRVLGGNGVGVQLNRLNRQIDENLVKHYRAETTRLSSMQVQNSFFERTQQMFGSPGDDSSLSHTLTQFSQAVESLAMAPHSAADQREMVRKAQELTTQFNDMSAAIQDLRLEADQRIGETVGEVNRLLDEVDNLNIEIVNNNTAGRSVSDLEDQRDVALDKLSGLIDSHVFKRDGGAVAVFTTSGRMLIGNDAMDMVHDAASANTAATTHADGSFSGIYSGAPLAGNDMTAEIEGGELKGLIELRDSILPDMQSALDELAGSLRDTVNQIHNRGTAFPGLQEMTGTRTFVDETTQEITISGNVQMVLLDSAGNEVRSGTIPDGTNDTVANIAATIGTFLGADGSASITDGRLAIDVNNASYSLAFRDESAATGAAADATIQFNADGDAGGVTDETVQGFSNFFGLNDFFVGGKTEGAHQSAVLPKSYRAHSNAQLSFTPAGGPPVAISQNDTLDQIVTAINDAGKGVTASLVPDGAGMRLRITSDDNQPMTVTAGAGETLLSHMGVRADDVGAAGSLEVRDDIAARPALIASAAVQSNSSGSYFASIGDNTTAASLADAFTSAHSFDTAGSLGSMNATFSRYASDLLSDNASRADSNAKAAEFQEGLVTSLKGQSDEIRGVNLDQEMSDLILYEQAYAAAARVISVVQNMFETLDRAIQ